MTTPTSSPILITGGTGTLGQHVVPALRGAGRTVRVLSRQTHADRYGITQVTGDLATGEGIDAAVADAEIVVHLAGSSKGDEDKARHLVDAAARAGVRHLVYISVVGADAVPQETRVDRTMFGYFAAKHGAERAIAESGIPWTTLRATQFHDLMLTAAAGMSKLPIVPVPSGFHFQPVDTAEVAARLTELALAPPAGLVADIAGPRVYDMSELLRTYLRVAGKHSVLVPLRLPGRAARAFREGANVAPGRAVGRRTWEDFLADRLVTAGPAEPVAA